jgi:hypothetical protein
MENLGITHVLNVTDKLPNFFELDDQLNISYKRINVDDRDYVPIKLAFPIAYNFLEGTFASTHLSTKKQVINTTIDVIISEVIEE